MSRLDDLLREELPRLAPRPRGDDPFDRVRRKRRAREFRRRAGLMLLAVAVVGGTSVGTVTLRRIFPATGGIQGTVAFVRLLRPCDGYHPAEGGLEVFAVDLATGEERLVSGGARFASGEAFPEERWPAFSPDGTFYVWVDHYRGALYRTEVGTGETTRIATFPGVDPLPIFPAARSRIRLSPDGRLVLFAVPRSVVVARAPDGGPVGRETADIYVVPADGSAEPALVTRGELPVWTPRGEIAFMRTDARVEFRDTPGGLRIVQHPPPTRFFLIRPDGSDLRQVYEAPGDVRILDADWSPDGSMIAAEVRRGRQSDIYVLDLEAREVRRLTDDPANDTSPAWSPDGSMIAFRTGRWGTGPGHSEIAVMSADGSVVHRVTADCWDDHDPTWVPDPSAVFLLPAWTPDVVRTPPPEATTPPPGATLSPAPTASPGLTPTVSPAPEPDLAAGCGLSALQADYDGDGALDVAVVSTLPRGGGCPEPGKGETYLGIGFDQTEEDVGAGALRTDVTIGPIDCGSFVGCPVFAAPDLDGDGAAELALVQDAGASVEILGLYRVETCGPAADCPTAARISPIEVAEPGDPALDLRPGPARIVWGGSVMERFGAYCGSIGGNPPTDEGGFVVWRASTSPDGSGATVHEALFRLRGTRLLLVETHDYQAASTVADLPPGGGSHLCGAPVMGSSGD